MNLRFKLRVDGEAGSPPPGVAMPASAWLTTPRQDAEQDTHQTIR